jgi:acyl-CoA thioesterase I
MNYFVNPLSLFVSVAALIMLFAAPASAAPSTLHILPLGDSITQGGRADREEYTYRYPLFCKLTDAGIRFEFVGSMAAGLQPGAKWPDYRGQAFDPHHEGHYGWKTAAVRDHLAEWMKAYPAAPDMVLIHLGTNDQGAGAAATTQSTTEPAKTVTNEALERKLFTEAVVTPLADMITMLRAKNPHVIVFVAHLNFNGGAALKIRTLVEELAAKLSTTESPVVTVHQYQGWHEKPGDPDSDTFDWAHPNPAGQAKMADKWFEAMKPYLKNYTIKR